MFDPFRRLANVRRVILLGRDAGDLQQIEKVVSETVLVLIEILDWLVDGGGHVGPPFWWALSGILGAAAEAVNTAGFNRPTITCVNLDDKICCCYHVSLRKLVNFARRERLQRASQMSQCLGAGTGCGWCIPILKRSEERRVGKECRSRWSPH